MRYSETLQKNMMYVALPLYVGQQLSGVLRTSIAVNAVDDRIGVIRIRIFIGALLIALLASGLSWFVSKRITIPIERMRDGARRFATGDLLHRLEAPDTLEFSALAESMNKMAEQLQQRMDEITNQRKKTESILTSMREGIIATDLDQRVISINPAAARMFGVPMTADDGRNIVEIIRNHDFQELMNQCLESGENLERDIVYYQGGE